MRVVKNKYAVAFGAVLKELRREAELSQDALAEKADLDRTFVSFLERGERQPSLLTIISLAGALGVQPDDIVRQTVERHHRCSPFSAKLNTLEPPTTK